jgi:hypothetical protein
MKKIITIILFNIFITSNAFTQVLYSNSIETGNRYNPGLNQLNNPKVAFDDVLIPSAQVAGSDSIRVTKLKLGIRRITGAGATDVKLYYTVFEDTSTSYNSMIKMPPVYLGTVSLSANTGSTFTQIITLGDSVNTLFSVKTDTGKAYTGYQTIFVGFAFTNSDANNGIRITNAASVANDDALWIYNSDSTVQRFATNFGGNPKATFYVQLYGNTYTTPLPVSIVDFKGNKTSNSINILWATVNEINNKGFYIQRSGNGISFENIAFVPAKSNGNSTVKLEYTFNDFNFNTLNNFYRLLQVDKDGKSTLTNVILVKAVSKSAIEFVRLYPNPASDFTTIKLHSNENNKVCNISIIDNAGKVVLYNKKELQAGINDIWLNLKNLTVGIYHLLVTEPNGEVIASKEFIIAR